MWVRKRLDIRWSDLGAALRDCLTRWDRAAWAEDVEELWSPAGDAFACLSVRTGFDLWLEALDLPRGSEVLVSAVTIRDMVRIVEEHGLVPVPVDIHPADLSLDLDSLKRAVTPRSRALLVAHLFGTRQPLEPILEITRQHGLLVAEDCAQAFAGRSFIGHPKADVSLFSFGPIKTATALGGAVLRVSDVQVRERMRSLHARLPLQQRQLFARRVGKYAAMKMLSSWPLFGVISALARLTGRNLDQLVAGSVRGFPGPQFFSLIRQQPCAALLALMFRRIAFFNRRALARRTDHGKRLLGLLRGAVRSPGSQAALNSYWVFPVLHHNAQSLVTRLQAAGFDAATAHSLCVVAPPADRPELRAVDAESMLPRIVHLPCYPEIPLRELRRMADEVRSSLGKRSQNAPAAQLTGAVADSTV